MDLNIPKNLRGLTLEQVELSRQTYGSNTAFQQKRSNIVQMLAEILKEPMLLLLIAVAIIYLILGEYGEAWFMLAAIVIVSGISFYQENRSKKALEELKKLNEPLTRVLRDGADQFIPTEELVVGDFCIVEEGKTINADGKILHSNDFSVNESALTGESFSVYKSPNSEEPNVFSGTLVLSGLAVFEIEKIGTETKLGSIGESLSSIREETTPLKLQIEKFVKTMAVIGIVVFLMVCIYSYYLTQNILESLLRGLTLAMSILPEEIPVAFSTFMALGAWRLMREGIIIKKSSTVETLGSATVICTDKTGTITENSMTLQAIYEFKTGQLYEKNKRWPPEAIQVIEFAMWASEPVPFDPMEISLHQAYVETTDQDLRKDFKIIHEYPIGGKPPMMTHIFENNEKTWIIAGKGAPEALLNSSNLTVEQKIGVEQKVKELGAKGFRVLGVGRALYKELEFPEEQQDFIFEFLGLVVFYDPPKKNIKETFRQLYEAGIKIKVITGDNTETTTAIAHQAGIPINTPALEGKFLATLNETELQEKVRTTTLFTRMFPEIKLAVVNVLKKDGEIVAMLGDGVNDAPALKASHIGVAMGKKGTEIAKSAASLVLSDDEFPKIVTAVAAGRRIYTNLKKAVQYIISIHIPIILAVSLPLFLGWVFPQIFTPVHVIFLELVMGPTCSIVYENEPMEKNTMQQPPRPISKTFLSWKELSVSVIQGLLISAGILFVYQWTAGQGGNEELTRTMVFTTLIFANIFLSLENRSFYFSVFESFRNKNNLLTGIILLTLFILGLMLYFPPVTTFFELVSLNLNQLLFSTGIAALSVLWFELWKLYKRYAVTTSPKN